MTTSKVFSRKFVNEGDVRNNAPAAAEVAMSIAGRSRLLWELAHGASAVPGEPPAIGPNPQGLIGVDWSGPPFGPCLLLPVACWQGRSGAAGVVAPSSTLSSIGLASASRRLPPWRVMNRHHVVRDDDSGPLQQLGFLWRATATAGVSSSFGIIVKNKTTGRAVAMTRTINSSTVATYLESVLVPMAPGANLIDIEFVRLSGDRTLTVESITLVVVAKRKHGLTFPG